MQGCGGNVFFKVHFSEVFLSKVYFCEMYPTCVSSKLCEFISGDFGDLLLTNYVIPVNLGSFYLIL